MYFIDQKKKGDNQILFFESEPILTRFYMYSGLIYNHYIEKSKEHKPVSKFDFNNDVSPLVELQTIAVFEHLLSLYHSNWQIRREVIDLPGARRVVSGPKIDNESKKDITKYSIDNFPSLRKSNRFYRTPLMFNNLAVPKNTKITFQEAGSKKTSYELAFKKTFFFDVSIKVSYSGSMIGLGKIGDFIGITSPERAYTDTSDPNVRDYSTYYLTIRCKAKFNRITAGNPSTSKYKEWSNDMFNNLYQEFDWTVCQDSILNYQKNKAIQKILNINKINGAKS